VSNIRKCSSSGALIFDQTPEEIFMSNVMQELLHLKNKVQALEENLPKQVLNKEVTDK